MVERPRRPRDNTMVRWCVNHAETYPAPVMAVRYPAERNRKNMPTWAWVRTRSASMAGSSGARMTRPVKFSRKIAVIRRTAGAPLRNATSAALRGRFIGYPRP